MDPLRLTIALGPLAIYLLVIGLLNLSRRPILTTGGRDTAALGIAVAGFLMAGPMELFLPRPAVANFGPYVWLLLMIFYGLCLTLFILLLRPRIVIYNFTIQQLRPVLADLINQLDADARWAGDSLTLPTLGVQLYFESSSALRNVQLVSAGPNQNYSGWKRLEVSLAQALRDVRVPPAPKGATMISLAVIMLATMVYLLVDRPQEVAQALQDMLRL